MPAPLRGRPTPSPVETDARAIGVTERPRDSAARERLLDAALTLLARGRRAGEPRSRCRRRLQLVYAVLSAGRALRPPAKERAMYIGLGTLALILVIILLVMLFRGRAL
jgi:hypothetical protein